MKINEYFKPTNLEEAYKILKEKNANIIGGGVYMRLGEKKFNTVLDLSNLGLNFIEEKQDEIQIGAMVTLRQIEQSEILQKYYCGMFSKAVGTIMGVQTRNVATIGGSVAGRYGFSDVITPLLALDVYVEFYKKGRMSLNDFLNTTGRVRDILTKVIIKKDNRKGSFNHVRNTSTDFSILNVAVSNIDNKIRISVGSRPAIAKLAEKAMKYLEGSELSEEAAIKAGEIAAEELQFGNCIRGTSEYRRELCKVLVKRCVLEVI